MKLQYEHTWSGTTPILENIKMSSKRLMSFVTQEQADELKKKRQEEWDRVRNPEDPEGNGVHMLLTMHAVSSRLDSL